MSDTVKCPDCGQFTLIETSYSEVADGSRVAFETATCKCGRYIGSPEIYDLAWGESDDE